MAALRRKGGSTGGGLGGSRRPLGGGPRHRQHGHLDFGIADELDVGFDEDFDDEFDAGGFGSGICGGASSGSADALMALFDDEGGAEDAFAGMVTGATGSRSSSSSMRPAKRKIPTMGMEAFWDSPSMHTPALKSRKGKKGRLLPEEMLDEPCDDDFFGDGFGAEDDFQDDFPDDFQDDFHDAFNDDLLGQWRPRRRKRSAWKIVYRNNPFGRLQLPPLRMRRQLFAEESQPSEPSASSTKPADCNAAALAVGSAGSDMAAPGVKATGSDVTAHGFRATGDPVAKRMACPVQDAATKPCAETQAQPAVGRETEQIGTAPVTSVDELSVGQELSAFQGPTVVEKPSTLPSVGSSAPASAADAVEGARSGVVSANTADAPRMPKFAFDFFREHLIVQSAEEVASKVDPLEQWRILSDEEKSKFMDMAEADKQRCEDEYETWRARQNEFGCSELPVAALLDGKAVEAEGDCADLGNKARGGLGIASGMRLVARNGRVRVSPSPGRFPSPSPGRCPSPAAPEAGRRRRSRMPKPEGYPEESQSAYKFFCNEYKHKLRLLPGLTQTADAASAIDKAIDEALAPDVTEAADTAPAPAAVETPALNVTDAADEALAPGVSETAAAESPVTVGTAADAPAEVQKKRRSSKGMDTLKKLRETWNSLPLEERERFESMAAADQQRFHDEHKAWRQQHPDFDFGGMDPESQRETGTRQHKRKSKKPEGFPSETQTRQRKSKPKKPEGFPSEPRSAYKIFCADKSAGATGADSEAAAAAGDPADVPPDDNRRRSTKGMETLQRLRAAWKNLSSDEMDQYLAKAAAETQRFAEEVEAWRQKQPDGGLGAAAEYLKTCKSSKLPRPVLRRQQELPPEPRGALDNVLMGAAALKRQGPREEKKDKNQSQQSLTEVAEPVQDEQDDDGWGNIGTHDDDLFDVPGSAGQSASASSTFMEQGSVGLAGLPTPLSAPTAMGPAAPRESVDDLLADFMVPDNEADPAVELAETQGSPQSFGPTAFPEEYAVMPWEEPHAAVPFSGLPGTVGAPKVLGPQLCFDESGNIVVNQSSLSKKMDRAGPNTMADETPVEDVSEYKKAYRRTAPTKWGDAESAQFYEALSLYGTDLFLVQTCFRNKSAAQIKAKFTREMKKFPEKVEEALLQNRKKLTTDTFERLHGKIDTSKHWKPPPTPEPGQEPEPDGSVPGAGDIPMPEEDPEEPMEPEYTEEDESHTTNRLMALFD